MEYTNIDASYNGLICKKVDVIDPENDNIIEMQNIYQEKSKISDFILTITIVCMLFIFFIICLLYGAATNKYKNEMKFEFSLKSFHGTILPIVMWLIIIVFLVFLILALTGILNN